MAEKENFKVGIEFKVIDIPTIIKIKRIVCNSKKELGTDYENAQKIMAQILLFADTKKINQYDNQIK